MKNKKGISLVVLTVTILIIIILAATVLFYVNDTMTNSEISAFALDIKNVEDLVYEYYLNNNTLPIDEDVEYTKTELLALISEGKDSLSKEITDNKDDSQTFYIVDLKKLPIEKTTKGTQANGDITDSYIVTKDSMNIYYLRGEKIGSKYYFSLTDELIKKVELEDNNTIDDSTIDIVNTTSSIKYKKSTNDWTNTLTVEIKTELEDGETFSYMLAGVDITESVTTNIVHVSEILSSNQTVKTAFIAENSSKVLKVQKIKDGEVLSETNIDISNLDILSGNTITQSNVKHTKYDKYTLASISGYTDLGGSGLKEVRVLYTTKLDSSGNSTPYYENLPQVITKDYVYSAGVRNEGLLLKLPADVTWYSLVFVDKAGNISDISSVKISTKSEVTWTVYTDKNGKTAIIPDGFIVSSVASENTVENGLVIYEGTQPVTDDNVAKAQETRDQFVWVPVPNINEFVRRDGYEKGTLQTAVSSGEATEPYSAISLSNDPTGEWKEWTEMRASVAEYGGFYIGRYETGTGEIRTSTSPVTDVLVQKSKEVYNWVPWGTSMTEIGTEGAVYLARRLYNTSSVKSTLCYGVQWDAVMNFMKDVENQNDQGKKYIEDSTGMGWYSNNSGLAIHKTGTDLDTNSSNMVKNIYDMAGNLYEWTMEANSPSGRFIRGAYYNILGSDYPASYRVFLSNPGNVNSDYIGFRLTLYIK